ncbi:MAG: ferredoxin [Caldiserica bacterium]|nr:MAG: ferredoxin [Caldisericota bacterium]
MPWVHEESCTGCGLCIENCPVDAISIENGKAKILMEKCIRCGSCHDICPNEAVRHDSEKIPHIVASNVELTKRNMKISEEYFGSKEAGLKCLDKMIKHFIREKKIAEQTIEILEKIKAEESK